MNKNYVGLDVHMASTSYWVRDSEGKVIAEGIVATGGANLLSLIRGIPGEVHLTFEEGTQAAWLYDLLKPYVKALTVCDPRKASQKQEDKSDRVDASRLSELLRVGGLTSRPRFKIRGSPKRAAERHGSGDSLVERPGPTISRGPTNSLVVQSAHGDRKRKCWTLWATSCNVVRRDGYFSKTWTSGTGCRTHARGAHGVAA